MPSNNLPVLSPLTLRDEICFCGRYFSSRPPPTEPALLPRPPPKNYSMDSKPSEFGPTVLSPNTRKTRRVMPEKGNDHVIGNEKSGPASMSFNFSVYDNRPPARPTINR